ncbi:DUF4350 domain-containing protein [Ruficoccus sp. ZRK36]|uniref:DUF4350 domain-containing protein n=1 Tax=Ruficoccus sp. ZRK36 TaxID=2866311 RepID=UPI001C73DEA0|nr:DUF4350 domain-containing protein [Ruficoccus sp. ZRK36]QYY35099.1 hypothetical protein K0V07_12410 [Ruficoccus sp. ZRK36]
MKRKRLMTGLGLMLAALLVTAALYYAFASKFTTGKMFPEHSSLRADPRGTMLLYESLETLPTVTAARWFEPFSKWMRDSEVRPQDTTVLFLDANGMSLMDEDLEAFLLQGGRVIVSLPSPNPGNSYDDMDEDFHASDHTPVGDDEVLEEVEYKTGFDGWELFALKAYHDYSVVNSDMRLNKESPMAAGAPTETAWLSSEAILINETKSVSNELDTQATEDIEDEDFTEPEGRGESAATSSEEDTDREKLPPARPWDVIYSSHTAPVIVGKQVGRGEIIVLANGLPLTNESLRLHKDLPLLKWLLGNDRNVVFEEYHFGIVQPHGIASLIREYGLSGALVALMISFLLFIWHGAFPLLPSVAEAPRPRTLGHTAVSGYRDLLRRHIRPRQLLGLCLEQWKLAFMGKHQDGKRYEKQFREAEHVVETEAAKPPRERNPGRAYQTISQILNQRRTRP